MNRTQQLLRSSALVLFLFGLNKITGFGKLLLMTAQFGAGAEADAFTAANQLPELFDTMLAGGALAAALIPVYSGYLIRQQRTEAVAMANTVVTLTLLVMGAIAGLAAWFALPLTRYLLVPEFSPEQQALTADLMRILLLSMMLFSIGSIFSSLLHAHQHFFTPALGTVLLDLGQIVGLYFLAPYLGIYGVAWGSVIGALLAWGVQVPAFWRVRVADRLQIAWRLAGLHEVARLMGPRIVTLGVVQAVDLVFIRLASPLPTGSIAAYYYALLIMVGMPKSLFGGAIATVIFPTLAEQYNRGDRSALRRLVEQSLYVVWALVVPGAVGLLVLGPAAVAFLLQRGAFDAEATALVYLLLAIFSVRLLGETTQDILALPFYARHNTRVPMWVSVGWAVVNVGLCYGLVGPLGIYGLALAATLAVVAATVALYTLNRWESGGFEPARLGGNLGRILLACGGMSGAVLGIRQLDLETVPYLVVAISSGGVVYGVLFFLLGGRALLGQLAPTLPKRLIVRQREGV
ncbi:MAG: murein biosynthesis integral membrane protein MurJ [Chloroflexi bacterium]|nr:MAG: murein biosynthesis integral membrane protein MurJ [Chloroflexota bacterium]